MRCSRTLLLALPALAVAENQVPLMDKVKGFFAKASTAITSAIPVSSAVNAAKEGVAAKAAEAIQYPLTLENWKETLTVDPTVSPPTTQEWLIFVTGGNTTCFGLCGNSTTAWNTSLPLLAAKPNAPKFGYLDCENESILCNSWSIAPPALYQISVPKPAADQSAPVPTVRYQPLNRSSTTTEMFKKLFLENDITKIPPYEGAFHPFSGWMHEYQLAVPWAYVSWAFSKMPPWLPMIAISFLTRNFMSKGLKPPPPPSQGAAQGAPRPAPAAAKAK